MLQARYQARAPIGFRRYGSRYVSPPDHSRSRVTLTYSIIGLSDGLMVPFALTAGLSSLGTSKLVYQGGLAELVAGAISMGVG